MTREDAITAAQAHASGHGEVAYAVQLSRKVWCLSPTRPVGIVDAIVTCSPAGLAFETHPVHGQAGKPKGRGKGWRT